MTVIAYRDGVMAADTLASDSVLKFAGLRKIARGADGTLYGISGRAGMCCTIARWIKDGCIGDSPPLKVDDQFASVLEVSPDGDVRVWQHDGIEDHGRRDYLSLGSGSGVALGAFHAGADAEGAAQAAIDHAPGCGGTVMAVRR